MTGIIRVWRRFLKCRKQNDGVKMIVLFILIGIGFGGYAVYYAIQIHTVLKTPVEYVLHGEGDIYYLEEMENVTAVSWQKENTLVLSDGGREITLDCLELSESYLSGAYHVSDVSAMKVIYLNQLAYGQLLHDWNWQENSEKSADFHASYVLGEEEKGKAKIQVIADGVPDDRARAFCAAKKADLVDEECSIRVQMAGQKTDGMDLSRLTKAGFQVVNEDDVQMTAMQLEMQWLRLRCGCLVTALCLLAAISLKKWAVGSGRR